ncbi:MAG: alpha-1,2-fucosyltransferase [Lachnospiraceae bacterium]|nr:alpha-1,2-fucosyltransferase [Lachnospiraceae bacterium]
MTIVHLSGGFGNQLFSYAFGYTVAKARGDKLYIDTAIQDTAWFFRNPDIMNMNIAFDRRLSYPIKKNIFYRALFNKIAFRSSIGMFTKVITEEELKKEKDPIEYCKKVKGNIYLRGNWGDESWFYPCRKEITRLFTFKIPLSEGAKKVAEEIRREKNSVTIHIRRGDYVKIGIALEKDYFKNAMEWIAEKVDNPVFYCFSEDLDWAKEEFKDFPFNIEYVDYDSDNRAIEDFRLLMEGHHQIISNSSFSWWAAYLNKNEGKQVVIPCMKNTMWDEKFKLPEWKGMKYRLNGNGEKEG